VRTANGLSLTALLGHPSQADAPLLTVHLDAAVSSVADAERMGSQAAEALGRQGAAAYLAAAQAVDEAASPSHPPPG
jgi:hypothetical protein